MSNANNVYHELARIRAATQASTAFQAVQTGVMADMNGVLDSIHGEMAEVRQLHEETVAAQQAMLQQEALQDRLEEFIYQTEKLVDQFRQPDSDIPPSSRYFTLLGVLEQIKFDNIGTSMIRGRDNKAAFDRVVTEIRSVAKALKSEPEVQDAIAWANKEQQKKRDERRRLEAQRRKEVQEELNRLNQMLLEAEEQPALPVPMPWTWAMDVLRNAKSNPITLIVLIGPGLVGLIWRLFFHPNPPPFFLWVLAMLAAYVSCLLPLCLIIAYPISISRVLAHNQERLSLIQSIEAKIAVVAQQVPTAQPATPVAPPLPEGAG